jgi:adenylate kinase family enzyme
MLRAAVAAGSDLGVKAKGFMDSGDLVPDDLIVDLIVERVNQADCADGFLLDGYPRTVPQADALGEALSGLSREVSAALLIELDDEEVIRRLSGRRVCVQSGHGYHLDFDPPKHMGMVEEVKAPIEVIQAPVEVMQPVITDYPIIKPDGEVYAYYESVDAWIAAYADLAGKVMNSIKLTDEQRSEKITALAAANQDITAHFSSFDKIKIKAELSKVGVTLNPKPPASPLGADLEHNEPIF